MLGRARPTARIFFRTDLDAKVPALPGRSAKSVLGLFAHLEGLARRHEGFETILKKSGPGRARRAVVKNVSAEETLQAPISFRDLGRAVIRAAQSQLAGLQHRLCEVQSLVLINNWAVADRLWAGLLPDCKTPLYEIGFVEELWGLNPDELVSEGWSLTRQWHEFVLIQAEFEILLGRRRSLVEFSDALERDLGRWLSKFGEFLEILDEASAV